MFSSWLTIDLIWLRLARVALGLMMLTGISAGWATGAHAQLDMKKAIVKIISSGTRVHENGTLEFVTAYEGSGFIVYSKNSAGGAETVIVTADHVLGYSQSKAQDPNNITFKEGEVPNPPPVWVNRNDERCQADLYNRNAPASELCRRIDVRYLDDMGRWSRYDVDVTVHRQGDKNQDFAVLWLKFFHDDQREKAVVIGNSYSLTEEAERVGSSPLPSAMAWGIEAGRPRDDPSTTQLTYRRRDNGPTLLFQPAVKRGNSGGPIVFKGKVIGIVSAVQGDETRVTRIQTVYDALSNWIPPAPSSVANPKVTVTAPENGWGGQCLSFAFENLPADFSIGKVRLNVADTRGPNAIAGSPTADIKTVTVSTIIPSTIFTDITFKPIEFNVRQQSSKERDNLYIDYCPTLDVKGQRGRLTVEPMFLSPGGIPIPGLQVVLPDMPDNKQISFSVSRPIYLNPIVDTHQ